MTRIRTTELLAETALVVYSAGFLVSYIVIKLACWPVGTWPGFIGSVRRGVTMTTSSVSSC